VITVSSVLKFISRAEHLAWRTRWKNGRWVKLSWTSEERDAVLRQDEAYRQADARWELNHGPIPSGAVALPLSLEQVKYEEVNRTASPANGPSRA
jgi:hypothetical protein